MISMNSLVHNRDLVIGVLTLLAAARAFYWLGSRLVERSSAVAANLAATAALLTTFLFALLFWGRLELAKVLPFTNVVLISNWIPLGAALLMGTVMAQPSLGPRRRVVVASLLGVLAWFTVARDLSGWSALNSHTVFQYGLPLQTGDGSCSACSAAMLLRHHGIQATEPEMTALCLTRPDGTPELGLYRGLKIKTRGTPWDIQIVCLDEGDVSRCEFQPTLALIQPPQVSGSPLSPFHRFGGPSHAVMLHGLSDDGLLVMADPVAGIAKWPPKDLDLGWPVKGIRLVRRKL